MLKKSTLQTSKTLFKENNLANSADLSAISILKDGAFSVKSFENNESKSSMVSFGDDVKMQNVLLWIENHLFTHVNIFFAVFHKFRAWKWDASSPMYINSPFLTFDNFVTNDFFDDISHAKDQKISEGINNMNYQDESFIGMSHYQTENAKLATEIASRKRSRSNIPSE